ncbi:glycoside hydrolase family 26 protein [Saccharicrinis sp. 156]|uniref:glycoside hydrolase family 26 protein n=1 Tax=Saccharicrinis sp. 156 TaxID=3417574 RepID=UPI003D3430E7
MKAKKIFLYLILLVITVRLLMACGLESKGCSELIDNSIIKQLKCSKGKGILFGHQDDLAYGIGWSYEDGESDVKRVTGDYPSIFGWELGGIELDKTHNLDSVPFVTMRKLALWGHQQGGINTFSWHPHSPIDSVSSWTGGAVVAKYIIPGGSHHIAFKAQLDRIADFFSQLKDENGQNIPFIFRPWHEMDGSWFWWGVKSCTSEEFKTLFRFTIEYLRNQKGLTQMTVAYSPDRNFDTKDEYLTWYPGDDVIDIMGMDNYWDFGQYKGEKEVIRKLHVVINAAKEKNKLAALTETGSENIPDSLWFTRKLGVVLQDSLINAELSYTMVWRNDSKTHFFFPYPGHPAADDAKEFCNVENILMLENYKELVQE